MNQNNISIEWESTGYSVLKNLNATVLGVFCEFIDNSIQSFKHDFDKIRKIHPNARLRIEIEYTGDQIIIRDNAGGINKLNFDRALKPANKNFNVEGLNEFGLGMKYAAVWISNEWELISSSIEENIRRKVIFNYEKVVTQNLKELPVSEEYAEYSEHGTTVILRLLEQKHVNPWQRSYLIKKLSSIYRNFLRPSSSFHDQFTDLPIDIIFEGENLVWEEYGFLKAPWWKEIQIKHNEQAPDIEWKFKFDWMSIPYEDEYQQQDGTIVIKETEIKVAGFVGILPDGGSKGKNGFVLFRRGRAVEGVVGDKVFPVDISGRQARSFKHIRLYGEIHFDNVDISFDKSKLSINRERRDEIFAVIATMLKNVIFDSSGSIKYDLISQSDKHRAKYSIPTASKAIESISDKISESEVNVDETSTINEQIAANVVFDSNYEETVNQESKVVSTRFPKIPLSRHLVGSVQYELEVEFTDNKTYLYNATIHDEDSKIRVDINVGHDIFIENKDYYITSQFTLIVKMIKCLVISELKAKISGNEAKHVKYAFNEYSKILLK